MNRNWKMSIIACLAACVLLLTACTANNSAGGNGDEGDEEDKKVLRLNNGQEPTSLDPPEGFDSVSWVMVNNLMEGLTRLDENHQPQAAMAENWDVSEDGKVYTFHLRDDAKWSNGDSVTANDFVYAWKHMLDPEQAYQPAFLAYVIEGAEAYNSGEGGADDVAIKAVDDKTLEITLTAPTGYFLNLLTNPAFFPVNEKVAQDNPEWFAEAESYVSNGPFKIDSWSHDKELIMAKNPEYWDAATVKIDQVNWAMVADTNTEYQMYQSGDLDRSSIPADNAKELMSSEELVTEVQAGDQFLRFNVQKEPFTNEKVRKAFAMAMNRDDIVEFIRGIGEQPARGFVPYGFETPSGGDFREENGDLVQDDPEEAKKLLAEGMEEEGWEELPAVTLTYGTNTANERLAEGIQSMLTDNLGVDVELQTVESSVFSEEQTQLVYQLFRGSFLADYGDPVNFLESFTTESSSNRTGWSNEAYDKLIADSKIESDEAKRFDMLMEAEKILMDEMPIIPLHFYQHVYLQKPNVKNIVMHPVGYLELKWADIE
jgi:dipeptide transport system substrate-binding protein